MQLYLCEKPSQAKDIAKVLGVSQRGQGYISGENVTVTWAVGHLLETATPEAYGEQYGRPWRANVLPVIPETWQMVVKKETADQFAVIKKLLKKAREVVIATDADREGEVIARELMTYCGYRGAIRRLWLSALDEGSIRQALQNMLPGEKTEKLYQAGVGRSQADWLIGMNLTRLYTLKAGEAGHAEMFSVGRVQTPTLAIVVNRDNEIANFTPKPWWQVRAQLEKDGVTFHAEWVGAEQYCDEEKRCINQPIAQAVLQLCQKTGAATVLTAEKKREKTPAPLCFELGKLQEVCSRKWGMGASQVLTIAQALYETHKATTYPRTDCGYLPLSMRDEVTAVLRAVLASDPSIGPALSGLDKSFMSRVWNDKKITAHHGIIPTRQAFDLARLSADELKVYQLIRQHYLAQFMPLQESDVTGATFNLGNQLFRTRGRVTVVPGWKALFGGQQDEDEEEGEEDAPASLPPLDKGDVCRVTGGNVKDNVTKAPAHMTEGTLIAAMKNAASLVSDPQLKKVLRENAGLGTEATRSGVLETLFKRRYLEKKGKHIHSTQMARELIAALPETLTSPGMTALWEQALDDIAQGKSDLHSFMQKQAQWTRHLTEKGRAQPFHVTVPVGPDCPLCGKAMRQRTGKEGTFWGCVQYPECKGIVGEANRKTKRRAAGKRRSSGPKVPGALQVDG
ncbi:DNA topoisomerase III [Pantoea agglomerans]|uniref:DNA topoisomerase III n=1 Tax=Enterobacter agglomerans TaxID=549 RepID=UPI00187888A4|nr:DNA topoisomerase III [Pantoea agglomerans]MBE5681860.1 DNA topoisomerase III [Pantoea agglomerans]